MRLFAIRLPAAAGQRGCAAVRGFAGSTSGGVYGAVSGSRACVWRYMRVRLRGRRGGGRFALNAYLPDVHYTIASPPINDRHGYC